MKKCSKCEIEKELLEFYKNQKSKDGYDRVCKECRSKSDKKYREKNKERLKIKKKEYRDRPEIKDRQKQWWVDNQDKRKGYRLNYDKDKERAHRKRWHKSFKKESHML